MPKTCAAANCKNNSDKVIKTISFFHIPIDPIRQLQWLEKIGRLDLMAEMPSIVSKKSVCSTHFEKSMFAGIFANNRLNKTAIPTLFLEGIDNRGVNIDASSSNFVVEENKENDIPIATATKRTKS